MAATQADDQLAWYSNFGTDTAPPSGVPVQGPVMVVVLITHRPLSSSFLWFIFRFVYGNPKKELHRGLYLTLRTAERPFCLDPEPSRGP